MRDPQPPQQRGFAAREGRPGADQPQRGTRAQQRRQRPGQPREALLPVARPHIEQERAAVAARTVRRRCAERRRVMDDLDLALRHAEKAHAVAAGVLRDRDQPRRARRQPFAAFEIGGALPVALGNQVVDRVDEGRVADQRQPVFIVVQRDVQHVRRLAREQRVQAGTVEAAQMRLAQLADQTAARERGRQHALLGPESAVRRHARQRRGVDVGRDRHPHDRRAVGRQVRDQLGEVPRNAAPALVDEDLIVVENTHWNKEKVIRRKEEVNSFY